MMELIYTIVAGLVSIASFVIFVIVLIKSFKQGGVLHGIIGLLTCGLYTFVWGWLKSKQLQLTKTMLLWTVMWVISIALPFVVGTTALMQSIPMMEELGLQAGTPPKNVKAFKKPTRKSAKKSTGKKDTARKTTGADTGKDDDWNAKAVALWKDDQYTDAKKAISYLGQAIKSDPKLAEAYNNRGNAYRETKQYANAIRDYNKAIALNANFSLAYTNRGNIYYDQRNYQGAIKDYNKSISLDPNDKLPYLNRGLAYHQLKRDDLACKDFETACKNGDCDGMNWARQSGICK
jgi:hypothetical protein